MEIFSGDYSRDMWDEINSAECVEDLRDALYLICCRLQELESKYDNPKDFHAFVKNTDKCECGSVPIIVNNKLKPKGE